MRALTLKQPWAHAVCYFGKRVENRSRRPPKVIIGERFAIHAGMAWDQEGAEALHRDHGQSFATVNGRRVDAAGAPVEFGAIVAVARLRGWVADLNGGFHRGPTCLGVEDPSLRAAFESAWFVGPFGWVLEDEVTALERPVPARGMLGPWRVSPSQLAAMCGPKPWPRRGGR